MNVQGAMINKQQQISRKHKDVTLFKNLFFVKVSNRPNSRILGRTEPNRNFLLKFNTRAETDRIWQVKFWPNRTEPDWRPQLGGTEPCRTGSYFTN